MDSCACCGKSVEESNSSRCYGFACEQRLCYPCYESKNGYCADCEEGLKRHPTQPDRSIPEKAGRVVDWLTGFADGAMKREVEVYEGEFDMYEDEDAVREMVKARYRELPEWKKKVYRTKKKSEMKAARAALKTATKGGMAIRNFFNILETPHNIIKAGEQEWDFDYEPEFTGEDLDSDELYELQENSGIRYPEDYDWDDEDVEEGFADDHTGEEEAESLKNVFADDDENDNDDDDDDLKDE